MHAVPALWKRPAERCGGGDVFPAGCGNEDRARLCIVAVDLEPQFAARAQAQGEQTIAAKRWTPTTESKAEFLESFQAATHVECNEYRVPFKLDVCSCFDRLDFFGSEISGLRVMRITRLSEIRRPLQCGGWAPSWTAAERVSMIPVAITLDEACPADAAKAEVLWQGEDGPDLKIVADDAACQQRWSCI